MTTPWMRDRASDPASARAASSRVGSVTDHLGEQRVVVDADDAAGDDAGVEADARRRRVAKLGRDPGHDERVQRPALRLPGGGRILGVEAHLDGVSGRRRRCGRQPFALGDADLQGDEVDAGRALRDGMLDLQPRVHLEEVEVAVVSGEELDGAGVGVADRSGRGDRGGEQVVAHRREALDERRRGLLDDLLVAALDRALALAERPHRAVLVGHHLHLDVSPRRQVGLAEHRRVAERGRRFGSGRGDLAVEDIERAHDAHAATTATGRGLDQHRQVVVGDGLWRQLGSTGTPAPAISRFASIFEPIAAIAAAAARSTSARRRRRRRRSRRSRTGSRSRDGSHRRRRGAPRR